MEFEAFIGCFCCRRQSKDYIRSCSVFFIVMSVIKILSFMFSFFAPYLRTDKLIFLFIVIVLELFVLIFGSVLLHRHKRDQLEYNFVQSSAVFLSLILLFELIILFYILMMFGISVSYLVNVGVDASNPDTFTWGNLLTDIMAMLVYCSLLFFVGIWQLQAAVVMIVCARYNMKKLQMHKMYSIVNAETVNMQNQPGTQQRRSSPYNPNPGPVQNVHLPAMDMANLESQRKMRDMQAPQDTKLKDTLNFKSSENFLVTGQNSRIDN